MLGGDRFYAIARWGVVFLLIAISGILTDSPVWPPLQSLEPIALLIWGYTLFSLLVSIALFVPPLGPLLSIAFAVDLAVLTLLTFFNRDAHDVLYPLYVLPLVGAAFRLNSSRSLWAGLLTAAAYVAAFLFARIGPDNGSVPRDALSLVGLTLRAAMLVFIPWITGSLAERWSASNRQSVALAEQKTQQAYTEAQAYRDQMRALYEVAYALATTTNYQNVLNVALLESRKLVPHRCAVVLLSTGEPDELFVAASNGLSESGQVARLQVGGGRIGTALYSAEPIMVEAYGATVPINQLGNINVPEPRMISVQVWDRANVKAVEKAIRNSPLGLNPAVDGTLLRIPLPELSEERRQELVKVAHRYAEQARIAIRNVRRDGMDQLKKLEKDGHISQDEHKLWADEVQALTDRHIELVSDLLQHKEKDIVTV